MRVIHTNGTKETPYCQSINAAPQKSRSLTKALINVKNSATKRLAGSRSTSSHSHCYKAMCVLLQVSLDVASVQLIDRHRLADLGQIRFAETFWTLIKQSKPDHHGVSINLPQLNCLFMPILHLAKKLLCS